VLRALLPALRAVGFTQVGRAMQGLRYRQRVQFDEVAGAFPIGALYVLQALRNRGIGGLMLAHADVLARNAAYRLISIETGITNPARHLYERHGYRLELTKTDADYERATGSAGRVLMLKRLS
jgi:GNAT superfamily N-acetyltransferase